MDCCEVGDKCFFIPALSFERQLLFFLCVSMDEWFSWGEDEGLDVSVFGLALVEWC